MGEITNEKRIYLGELMDILNFLKINLLLRLHRLTSEGGLENRKGECNKCGKCCWYKDVYRYKYLVGNCCSLWENRPQKCRDFPRDERELEITKLRDVCSYHWD